MILSQRMSLSFYKCRCTSLPLCRAHLPDWSVKIIEFGPFGIDMNACSCYYNWLQDAHILYNARCQISEQRRVNQRQSWVLLTDRHKHAVLLRCLVVEPVASRQNECLLLLDELQLAVNPDMLHCIRHVSVWVRVAVSFHQNNCF